MKLFRLKNKEKNPNFELDRFSKLSTLKTKPCKLIWSKLYYIKNYFDTSNSLYLKLYNEENLNHIDNKNTLDFIDILDQLKSKFSILYTLKDDTDSMIYLNVILKYENTLNIFLDFINHVEAYRLQYKTEELKSMLSLLDIIINDLSHVTEIGLLNKQQEMIDYQKLFLAEKDRILSNNSTNSDTLNHHETKINYIKKQILEENAKFESTNEKYDFLIDFKKLYYSMFDYDIEVELKNLKKQTKLPKELKRSFTELLNKARLSDKSIKFLENLIVNASYLDISKESGDFFTKNMVNLLETYLENQNKPKFEVLNQPDLLKFLNISSSSLDIENLYGSKVNYLDSTLIFRFAYRLDNILQLLKSIMLGNSIKDLISKYSSYLFSNVIFNDYIGIMLTLKSLTASLTSPNNFNTEKEISDFIGKLDSELLLVNYYLKQMKSSLDSLAMLSNVKSNFYGDDTVNKYVDKVMEFSVGDSLIKSKLILKHLFNLYDSTSISFKNYDSALNDYLNISKLVKMKSKSDVMPSNDSLFTLLNTSNLVEFRTTLDGLLSRDNLTDEEIATDFLIQNMAYLFESN